MCGHALVEKRPPVGARERTNHFRASSTTSVYINSYRYPPYLDIPRPNPRSLIARRNSLSLSHRTCLRVCWASASTSLFPPAARPALPVTSFFLSSASYRGILLVSLPARLESPSRKACGIDLRHTRRAAAAAALITPRESK